MVTSYDYVNGYLIGTNYWGTDVLYQSYLTAQTALETLLDDEDATEQQITDAEAALQSALEAGLETDTPSLAYQYDNFGRITEVTRAGQLHASYQYDPATLLLKIENLNQDTPKPQTLQRYYDSLRRPMSVRLYDTPEEGASPTTVNHSYAYGYDTVGRLDRIWDKPTLAADGTVGGAHTFKYEYLANSGNLIEKVTGPVHIVQNQWEPTRNVLEFKTNTISSGNSLLSKYDYEVNDMGQRTKVEQTGSAFTGMPSIDWGYNDRGELVQADHSTGTQDRAYDYDAIGNRIEAVTGTTTLTGSANYPVNGLNQYTSTPESLAPAFDLDGNQLQATVPGVSHAAVGSTADATNMVWDAENRLIRVTSNGVTMRYDYDYLGRRISSKKGSAVTHYYHYDGWNRLTLYVGSALNRRYTWGLDLSGTMQGAGSVGGLLTVDIMQVIAGNRDYYPVYDGNGNVCQYLGADGSVAARFEYDPFGRITFKDGIGFAQYFRYRFSTKFRDYQTGLYDYGYRWYNPVDGRWPSRDPIGERGGTNLYGMIGNDTVNWLDYLGKIKIPAKHAEKTRTYKTKDGDEDTETLKWGFTIVSDGKCNLKVVIPVKFTIPISGHGDRFKKLDRDKQRLLKTIKGEAARGMNANQRRKARMKQHFDRYNGEIARAWNDKVIVECDKCNCPDGFSISVELKWVPDGKNVWDIALLHWPQEKIADQLVWNTSFDNVAAHEVGHFLGNFDEYNEPNPEKDSVMNDEDGVAKPRHFKEVSDMIGRKLKTKCKAVAVE